MSSLLRETGAHEEIPDKTIRLLKRGELWMACRSLPWSPRGIWHIRTQSLKGRLLHTFGSLVSIVSLSTRIFICSSISDMSFSQRYEVIALKWQTLCNSWDVTVVLSESEVPPNVTVSLCFVRRRTRAFSLVWDHRSATRLFRGSHASNLRSEESIG